MDPLITPAITLLNWIVMYLQEKRYQRDNRDPVSTKDLLQWIEQNQGKDVANQIGANTETLDEISRFLTTSHADVVDRLSSLNDILDAVLKHLSGWSAVVRSRHSTESLSSQSLSILQQLNNKKSSGFICIHTSSGKQLIPIDGERGEISISDLRFLEADLKSLVDIGFLIKSYTSKYKDPKYVITRPGALYGEQSVRF